MRVANGGKWAWPIEAPGSAGKQPLRAPAAAGNLAAWNAIIDDQIPLFCVAADMTAASDTLRIYPIGGNEVFFP
jgi:hypothetical protein